VKTVPGITTATALSAYCDDYNPGPAHACVLQGGAVWCWGSNGAGEVGNGSMVSPVTAPFNVAIAGSPTFVSIAAARDFTCAVTSTGKVYCWGQNGNGQLGRGTITAASATPQAVVGITTALGVTAREDHACAWLADGTVRCWGTNREGQLGNGTFDDNGTPVVAKNVANVTALSAGAYHTCALQTGGTVSCWGSSYDGQVGTGITGEFTSPTQVVGL